MDQHKEKEKEDKFQESSEQPRKEEAEEADTCEESWEQQPEPCKEGRSSEEDKQEEELTAQLKVVESAAEEEEASSSLFAHPCSLLRYLLRFCAGCWGLHGAFGDDPKPQPQAAGVVPPEAVAPANSSEKGEGEEKANYFYMQGEVVTRVWAVRRGRPPGAPGHPREGSGGNGGHHH